MLRCCRSRFACVTVSVFASMTIAAGSPRGTDALAQNRPRTVSDRSAADSTDIAAWRAHVEYLTRDGSWWWTSNAHHSAEDGGIEAYAMAYVALPGGLASRGCLWWMRAGSPNVAWQFFQGWDPAAAAPFFYQTNAGGASGMGTGWTHDGGSIAHEQTFRWADGSTTRLAHLTTPVGRDSLRVQSRAWVDGAWAPRRSYTWVRRDRTATPCDG